MHMETHTHTDTRVGVRADTRETGDATGTHTCLGRTGCPARTSPMQIHTCLCTCRQQYCKIKLFGGLVLAKFAHPRVQTCI